MTDNFETNWNRVEENAEKFPSIEEIRSVFGTLLQGKKYTELRTKTDDAGLSFYEVEVINEDGSKTEYSYQKAKNDYKDPNAKVAPGCRFAASIHTVEYDVDGMPTTGNHIANYLDGEWTYL
ncbi:MAG: hypothetical protein V4519_03820 [Patescibacteria group bacterium]